MKYWLGGHKMSWNVLHLALKFQISSSFSNIVHEYHQDHFIHGIIVGAMFRCTQILNFASNFERKSLTLLLYYVIFIH